MSLIKSLIKFFIVRDQVLESEFPMVVNNDHIGKQILIDGYYERFYLENIINHFDPKVFEFKLMDIGANIGNHTVYFSKYFKEVLSFEPQKRTFKLLKLNCLHLPNVKLFNYGLSEKSEKVEFKIHKMNFGNAKQSQKKSNEKDYFIENVVVQPHKFHSKEVVSVIKIDVEGSECDVLSSLDNKIQSDKPILLFEFNDLKIKNKLKHQLNKMGYNNFYVFKKELVKSKIKKVLSQNLDQLVKIDLSEEYDFSMVISFQEDSKFKLKV